VKRSIRETLADSHVAAVSIAVLLLWSLDGAFHALWPLIFGALKFLFTAIAILDIPYFSSTPTIEDRIMLITASAYLYSAAVSLSAAWILSRWMYGVGPLRTLVGYRSNLVGSQHV
jgi:hypothetical protein